MKNTELHLRSQ